MADEIVAGFLSADRIEAGTISTQKLTPLVGQELDLSENDSIERNTYIQMLPDQIVTYVGEKGYGRTFISLTDPALDPANDVHPGDYWVKQDPELEQKTWEYCHQKTWEGVDQHVWYEFVVDPRNWGYNYYKTWGELSKDNWYALIDSVADMYCRKGTGENGEWIIVNDRSILSEAYTRITQNKDAIIHEAYRANAAEGELHSEIIQTADSITTMVERTYFTKTSATQMANELTDQAIELANNAAESAKAASIAKTTRYQSAEAIVETAVAVVDLGDTSMLPEFNENTQYYKGNAVKYNGKGYLFTQDHKGAWNPNHVKEIMPYIAQTTSYQTADMLHNSAVRVAGENASATYIAKSGSYTTVTAILNEAQNKADAATSAKDASIAKTDVIQTAEYILQQAVAVVNRDISSVAAFSTNTQYEIGDIVKYDNGDGGGLKIWQFTARHKGAWSNSHAKVIPEKFIAQTTNYQTADEIYTAASKYTDDNAYKMVSSISIKAEGITMKGSTYIKLESGATIECNASQIKFSTSSTLQSEMNKKSNISNMTSQYYKSSSPNKLQDGSWTDAVQTHTDGWYIFSRTKVTYSDGSNPTYTPSETGVCIEGTPGPVGPKGDNGTNGKDGKDGKDGTNGADGRGISSMTVQYALGSSPSNAPSSGWQDTVPAYQEGKYYWTKTVVNYTSGSPSTFYACETGVQYAITTAKSAADAAYNYAHGKSTVPKVVSTGFTMEDGDITISGEKTITVQTNKKLTFSCYANSSMVVDDNGVSIGTLKDVAIAASGSISLRGDAGLSIGTDRKLRISGGAVEIAGDSHVTIQSGGYININKYSFSEEQGFQWDNSTESTTVQGYMCQSEERNYYGSTIPTWLVCSLGMGLHLRSEYTYVMQFQCHEFVWWGFGSTRASSATEQMKYGIIAMEVDHGTKQLGFTWREDYTTDKTTKGCLGGSTHPWVNGYITNIYGTIRGTSSRAIKHNITEIKSNGEVLDKLSPITFIYNDDKENVQHSGLIYEDTVGVMPEICHDDGITKSICYVELVPYLLKEIQDLRRRVKQLEK